jgi:TolB-like protein
VEPSADQVRQQLDRILASDVFAGGGRAASLLRYLVTRTLEGEGDRLKEYVVGVELFERGDDFDPRTDTIVRVEARRLRARLDDYYRGPGASDLVRIEIPRGSYAAMFAASPTPLVADVGRTVPANGSPHRNAGVSTAKGRSVSYFGLISAAVMLAVLLGGWMVSRSAPAAVVSRVAVLPLAHFSTDAEVALVAARLTDGVTAELARVPEFSVVSRSSAAGFASERQPIREAARALGVELVIEGSVIVEAGGIHVVTRLVDAARDRKVWVGEYDSPPDQVAALQRRIAADAKAAILERRARAH